jgi:hypothetical protein
LIHRPEVWLKATTVEPPPRLIYLVTEDWYFVSHRLPMARARLAAISDPERPRKQARQSGKGSRTVVQAIRCSKRANTSQASAFRNGKCKRHVFLPSSGRRIHSGWVLRAGSHHLHRHRQRGAAAVSNAAELPGKEFFKRLRFPRRSGRSRPKRTRRMNI